MSHRSFARASLALLFAVYMALAGCELFQPSQPVVIKYVGSSTVANFLREAQPAYQRVQFEIDDEPESAGGERAILAGTADLAGIARKPRPETLRAGIASRHIGRDAIAVIVNPANPVGNLTLPELRAIFSGRVRNWNELGWRDLPIQPFIVGTESATRPVFRERVLDTKDYAGCQEVRPDRDIIGLVAKNAGAIGHISFSFLNGGAGPRRIVGGPSGVKAVAVEAERPDVTNFDYPIARNLYLLFREGGKPEVEEFVNWAQTEEGQQVVMRRFVGIRVYLVVGPTAPRMNEKGTLVVYTDTFSHYDGGIWYYPHRSYDVFTRYGDFVRRVRNHRGQNDEKPMKVRLDPGMYLIRPQSTRRPQPEFFVKIESGKTTELSVQTTAKPQ